MQYSTLTWRELHAIINTKCGISPCLKIWPGDLDLWPWKLIGFQILLRTKYVSSLVKIHWRMLILVCPQGCYRVKIRPCDFDLWPMTLKINRVPDFLKDWVCTKFGKNPLKDVDFRVCTRMLRKDGRTDGRQDGRTDGRTGGRTVALLYPFATSLARG